MVKRNNILMDTKDSVSSSIDNKSELTKIKIQNLKRNEKTEDKRESKKTSGELPNNIRFYRKKYGYTQEKLQDEWNVTQQAISKYETGEKKNFKPLEIKTILDTFPHLSFDELFVTGRLSVCVNKKNQKLLEDYLKGMKNVFPTNDTEYEKINVIVNHILKIFLEGNISIDLQNVLDEELQGSK
jgi:transcriptional regulator with XRE-family HTH domain